MRPISRTLIIAVGACWLAMVDVGAVGAQNPWPVVLQHGYRSDGDSWDVLKQSLQANFFVQPRSWTTFWTHPLDQQARFLHDTMTALGMPDSSIVIGHSNGGLIARQLSRYRNLRAVLTVGSLHSGAPLAQSLKDGLVQGLGELVAGYAVNVGNYYTGLCVGRPPQDDYGFCLTAIGAAATQATVGAFIVGLPTAQLFGAADVLEDMYPGAPFISFLNIQPNLNREAQAIQYRYSVRSSLLPDYPYTIYRATLPDAAWQLSVITDAAMTIQALGVGFYDAYHDPDDPYELDKIYGAPLWGLSAAWLVGLDVSWCGLIGALDGLWCTASDGIVPHDKQWWPGAINLEITRPAHQEEKGSPEFFSRVAEIFQLTLGVPGPGGGGGGGGGGGFSASITGTALIHAYTGCSWSAVVSGGVAPYNYSWTINGLSAGGNSESISYTNDGNPFALEVVVTDQNQQTASTSFSVGIESGYYCS